LPVRYPETSRSTWQKLIKAGNVKVNDSVQVESPKHDITENDDIAVDMPTTEDHSDKGFPIIYIDDNVVVIDKPSAY
jgi:23S rRNA pseudouridine1911/1915/1917 synthase